MRSQFLLFPAAIVASAPAYGDNFLTVEQAQSLLFPGAAMTPADFTMNEKQVDLLIKTSQTTVYRSKVKAWRASAGGWFFLDQVPGKDDRVTYALALDQDGTVIGIEILVCLPVYGGVRQAEWRDQFRNRSYVKEANGLKEASTISGQTLTTAHVAEGINRLLATYALFLGPRQMNR